MKVLVESLTKKALEEREYRDSLTISIDDEKVFEVWDDEPEDSNLRRTFSPCFSIPSLLQKAWEAGRKGEEFTIQIKEVDQI